ncbi:hypothetical protein [Pseudomonas sp. CFBP 8772]|uniref:hypothetical protein n=1 Tax=Pseudomonas sp. CFBP 8772 TaxID=2775284 RepID=UPI001785BA74|nr:hypothetical protein [Pseudomonas sp. CFBP 8772]MBD8598729.1 hypothetical protein [Pseudomonas sp. CFBP 8772]
MQVASEAIMAQARILISDIESALSQELAEFNTLLVGAYLTQALNDGQLNREEFNLLTRSAGDTLRNYIAPSPI